MTAMVVTSPYPDDTVVESYTVTNDGTYLSGVKVPMEKFFGEKYISAFKEIIEGAMRALEYTAGVDCIVFATEIFGKGQMVFAAAHFTNGRKASSYKKVGELDQMVPELIKEIKEADGFNWLDAEVTAFILAGAAARLGACVKNRFGSDWDSTARFVVKDGSIKVKGSFEQCWFEREI